MFQFGVSRHSGAVPKFPGVTFDRPKPRFKLRPPWLSNMDGVRSAKKSTGDHCQPLITSFTTFGVIVERNVADPLVRYDAWCARSEKPGKTSAALFSVSGMSSNRCQ